jgi:hypothetical protein
MSWAAFERLPRQMGWKHEYLEGTAYLRPNWRFVRFELDLTPRFLKRRRGIRPATPADKSALRQPFLDAFAQAPDYVGYSMAKFRQAAEKYLAGYFGDIRGGPSPVSVVAKVRGELVGAALVKYQPDGPLLDCIFVRPNHARNGWATALASYAVNGLIDEGATILHSGALLANTASLAWHSSFDFREVPDEWIAGARWRHYAYELERHDRLGDLLPADRSDLEAQVRHWADESERLEIARRAIVVRRPQPEALAAVEQRPVAIASGSDALG